MSTLSTRYLPIADFPGYRVDDDGTVWSRWSRSSPNTHLLDEWHQLKPCLGGRNYLRVGLARDKKTYHRNVHRLVLDAFVGPCPPGFECRHLDGDPLNNRLDNLAWGTKRENAADKVVHGTAQDGSHNPMAKLTEQDVLEIRASAKTQKWLAQFYGVGPTAIGDIRAGKSWQNVGGIRTVCTPNKLTEQDVLEIRASAESLNSLARIYGVSRSAVALARSGKTWKAATSPG